MTGSLLIYLVPVVLVLGLLALGVAMLTRQERGDRAAGEAPANALLGRSSLTLYHGLREAVGDQYSIFATVRVADILRNSAVEKELAALAKAAPSARFDFLLCAPDTTERILAIELDRKDRRRAQRDKLVAQTCSAADLPLLRIAPTKKYSADDLAARIEEALKVEEEPEG